MHSNHPLIARSQRALDEFCARVADLGGSVLETEWLGSKACHRVRCSAGHVGTASPNGVQQGGGICRPCAGKDPETAWRGFCARVAELGGSVLETEWLGARTPHRVRCMAGHECAPRPNSVQQGGGLCEVCVGHDSDSAWQAFRKRVEKLGGVVLETEWLGNAVPHRVRCAEDHEWAPLPAGVQQGQGICRPCAGKDPETAWRGFCGRVAELGGSVLETEWLGALTPHRVQCVAGHECNPRPAGVQSGQGLCRVCAGNDSATAERQFRARVAELGGTVLEPIWLGSSAPHRVRCAAGHECDPLPGNVRYGSGLCRKCAGLDWDVFYVVTDEAAGRLKFGVTSGIPRPRLNAHAREGYRTVTRLLTGLPDGGALELERSVRAALKVAGHFPIRGREYFDILVSPLVLTTIDKMRSDRLATPLKQGQDSKS